MGLYVTVELAKKHLNIEESFTADDSYIEDLINDAEGKVAAELCVTVQDLATMGGGTSIPAPLHRAILLTVGGYYSFREDLLTVQTKSLEQGSMRLIQLYRNFEL